MSRIWVTPISWTLQRTWVSGETLTEPLLSQHVTANLFSLRNCNDHYVKIHTGNSPSIPNNTTTPITWGNVVFQVGTIWSAGVPTRFTAPVNGVYALIVNLEWRPNATGQRAVLVERSTGVTDEFQSQGSGGSKSNQSIYAEFSLTSGQYLVVRALQVSGAALTLHGGNKDRTRASCWLIGQVV